MDRSCRIRTCAFNKCLPPPWCINAVVKRVFKIHPRPLLAPFVRQQKGPLRHAYLTLVVSKKKLLVATGGKIEWEKMGENGRKWEHTEKCGKMEGNRGKWEKRKHFTFFFFSVKKYLGSAKSRGMHRIRHSCKILYDLS